MACSEFWKLFYETGDIMLYLLYREEISDELLPGEEINCVNGEDIFPTE